MESLLNLDLLTSPPSDSGNGRSGEKCALISIQFELTKKKTEKRRGVHLMIMTTAGVHFILTIRRSPKMRCELAQSIIRNYAKWKMIEMDKDHFRLIEYNR